MKSRFSFLSPSLFSRILPLNFPLTLLILASLAYPIGQGTHQKFSFGKKPPKLSSPEIVAQEIEFLYSQILRQVSQDLAQENWEKALELGSLASAKKANSVESLKTSIKLWEKAMNYLSQIPVESTMLEAAIAKRQEYQKYRDFLHYQLENQSSGWLHELAQDSSISAQRLHITVCSFSEVCRRYQGRKPMKSPASLIKLPIAVAIMEKSQREAISLDTEIKLSPNNFTEDASDLRVGRHYPLEHLILRMINQSSNIGTNQLIDYMGWQNINAFLRESGYSQSFVGFKLIGDRTYPTNAGCCSNRLTTDELTKMMLRIYTEPNAQNQLLLKFLSAQEDETMGKAVFQGEKLRWLGEKTGRSSRFKGTTVATQISEQKYVITVGVSQGVSDRTMREILEKIGQKIVEKGSLEDIENSIAN